MTVPLRPPSKSHRTYFRRVMHCLVLDVSLKLITYCANTDALRTESVLVFRSPQPPISCIPDIHIQNSIFVTRSAYSSGHSLWFHFRNSESSEIAAFGLVGADVTLIRRVECETAVFDWIPGDSWSCCAGLRGSCTVNSDCSDRRN